jgi:nucleoside-diphosphate-sugar epimerase
MPTSIAVFGGEFQKKMTPVNSATYPETIYGVAKVFNEGLGSYYFRKYGVDFRALRYPCIISSENG